MYEATYLGVVGTAVRFVVHVERASAYTEVWFALQVLPATELELLLVSMHEAVRELVQLVLDRAADWSA